MARKRVSSDDSAAHLKREKPTGGDDDFSWTYDDRYHVYIGRYRTGAQPSSRIAAFDFDGTLSVPKSGKKFPRDGQDFQLLDPRLGKRLADMTADRSFLIFTNQMGVGKHTTSQAVRERISSILKLLGPIPCTVFASTVENEYRKPRRGMFDLFLRDHNAGMEVDLTESVYVGDAAGRKKTASRPKDHSDADFLFSRNCGLNFMTPEQFLAGESIESAERANEKSLPRPHDPKEWLSPLTFGWSAKSNLKITDATMFEEEWAQISDLKCLVVVLVGIPGSGKSHFVQRFCSGWQIISRDKTGTMDKCEKELVAATGQKGYRVVIDNTNFDLESRKRWLSIVQRHSCTPVAVWMDVSVEQALHNNSFRRLAAIRSGTESAQMVPTFVIRNQANKLVAPCLEEGFEQVFRLNFLPHFDDESLLNLYKCYL